MSAHEPPDQDAAPDQATDTGLPSVIWIPGLIALVGLSLYLFTSQPWTTGVSG